LAADEKTILFDALMHALVTMETEERAGRDGALDLVRSEESAFFPFQFLEIFLN
jgi:hypothetical protein